MWQRSSKPFFPIWLLMLDESIADTSVWGLFSMLFLKTRSYGRINYAAVFKIFLLPFVCMSLQTRAIADWNEASYASIISKRYPTRVYSFGRWKLTCSEIFYIKKYTLWCWEINLLRENLFWPFHFRVWSRSPYFLKSAPHLSTPIYWIAMDVHAPLTYFLIW